MVNEVKDSENLEQMKMSYSNLILGALCLQNSPDGYEISCSSISDKLENV